MSPRRFCWLLASLLLLAVASAQETKILTKNHDTQRSHDAIEDELRHERIKKAEEHGIFADEDGVDVDSFTCTLTGASGQEQCDATKDDDGTGCVWCTMNSFGFCVSEEQAQTIKQVVPTIDCDDDKTDDKAPPDDDKAPGPLWACLESKDEAECGTNSCVWCDTKGKFGVCLTKEAADMAANSYWFDCKTDENDEEEADGDEDDEYSVDEDDYEDDESGSMDGDEETDEDDDMHEFVVDTSCVLSAMFLDPDDLEIASEDACFQTRDVDNNPCEWCTIAGSPFRLCLSEPQAQVAEYVGAVCTGSDESFEPEEFDDSCIAHMHNDRNLTRDGCWKHMDLDGNGCEWCNMMGVELCLGGVQAELVEHWGATCVLDEAEHKMSQDAIKRHQEYTAAFKESERSSRAANAAEATPDAQQEESEDELDLATLWLTSDASCMVTTLRTSLGDDGELACAQTHDAQGNACNWCEIGTSFFMCLNDEQADLADYMGIACETITVQKDHDTNSEGHDDDGEETDEEEDDDEEDDIQGFDSSCIVTMQNGVDKDACLAAKDEDGTACEWCSYNTFQICLTDEQANFVTPFGVTCDKAGEEKKTETGVVAPEEFWSCLQQTSHGVDLCASTKAGNACTWCNTQGGFGVCLSNAAVTIVNEYEFFDCMDAPELDVDEKHVALKAPKIDTSCLVDGRFGDEKCESSKDSTTGHPCEWCTLGSLGVNACLSAEQAQKALPLGVTCKGQKPIELPKGEPAYLLQSLPTDFWSCLSQSQSVDECDESCTWCDLKGSSTGAGLCLSDYVADAAHYLTGDDILECTEPEYDEVVEDEVLDPEIA